MYYDKSCEVNVMATIPFNAELLADVFQHGHIYYCKYRADKGRQNQIYGDMNVYSRFKMLKYVSAFISICTIRIIL